jgi:GTP-binding protein EngB required for normal cell division
MATNISKQLTDGSFGTFQSLFDALKIDKKDFVLPKVVIVGDESAGKSSLVENLTKCAVFPRASGICTKMPIRIEMVQTKTAVCFEAKHGHFNVTTTDSNMFKSMLEEYMTSLTTIVDEEMVVKIESPDVITFTVIDLPGIRAYPEEMAMATRRIADKYLSDPDTIPICVVPATVFPLTTATSIGRVKAHGREANTILVLTKPDEVIAHKVQDRVLDRVLMTSDELSNLGFASCVTVMNREHDSSLSLTDADDKEKVFFDNMVNTFGFVMVNDEMNTNATTRGRMGITALTKEMDRMYHQVIMTLWKPKTIQVLLNKLDDVTDHLAELGPYVTIYGDVVEELLRLHKGAWGQLESPVKMPDMVSPNRNTDTREWAETMTVNIMKMKQMFIDTYCDSKEVPLKIQEAIMRTFATDSPFKLQRFNDLQLLLCKIAADKYEVLMRNVFRPKLNKWMDIYEFNLMAGKNLTEETENLIRAVNNMVKKDVVFQVDRATFNMPSEEPVYENLGCQELRLEYNQEIANLQSAVNVISAMK